MGCEHTELKRDRINCPQRASIKAWQKSSSTCLPITYLHRKLSSIKPSGPKQRYIRTGRRGDMLCINCLPKCLWILFSLQLEEGNPKVNQTLRLRFPLPRIRDWLPVKSFPWSLAKHTPEVTFIDSKKLSSRPYITSLILSRDKSNNNSPDNQSDALS